MYPEALIIEPMKINKIPEGKEHMFPSLCEGGQYFAQLKKDGYWYMLEKTANHIYLFSRNKSVETGTLAEKSANVPHIMQCFSALPPGTTLIGEIYYPGKRSKDVTPIMGSLPQKAIERQEGEYGFLHYYVHDMIRYADKDLTKVGASIRYKLLEAVFEKFNLANEFIELAARVDENIQEFVADALERGEEGAVLKKKTAPYTPGKRPAWDTIKIKKTDTCDAICIGFGEPTREYTGKEIETWPYWEGDTAVTKPYYYGWKTSMEIGAYDKDGKIVSIGSVSSGLTEHIQEIAGKNPEVYLGRVVKLAGMEKDHKAKTLRHFYFKGFHEDKPATDCRLDEIF